MREIKIKIENSTKMVYLPPNFKIIDGENLQDKFVFKFMDEFIEGQARLEFEANYHKNYIVIDSENETYVMPVKSMIAKAGKVDMQLVVTEHGIYKLTEDEKYKDKKEYYSKTNDIYTLLIKGTDYQVGDNIETEIYEYTDVPIFKSKEFFIPVEPSINAVDEAEEGYPLWIDKANAKLNQVDEALIGANNAITQANNLDLNISDKIGKDVTIILTKKDATQKTVVLSDGTSLQFNWDGTKLGIKTDEDQDYVYVDLKGDKGDRGYTSTIQIGTTATLPAGSNATVENVGTINDGIFNFGIPQGIQGETGNGISSIVKTSTSGLVDTYTITYTNGNTTTFEIKNGAKGEKGDKGDDYVITESDYNNIAGVVETDIQPTISAIENTADTANTTANTAKSIAEGANQALSFGNYATMVTSFNALGDNAYKVGQNVYIVTTEVPDLWVSSIESTSSAYTYTTDSALINDLVTNGYIQTGYYKLSMLETQKVDLTNYIKNTDYATNSTAGIVSTASNLGTGMSGMNIFVSRATESDISNKTSAYKPITPRDLDYAIKVGMATNTTTLTESQKSNACNWLGTGKMVTLTQVQYDAITTKDADTYYFIIEE